MLKEKPKPVLDFAKLPTSSKQLYIGMKVGLLRLLGRTRSNPKASAMTKHKWRVECTAIDCGKKFTIPQSYLVRRPLPKWHCGCLNHTIKSTHAREYRIWTMMRVRCTNPTHVAYKHYGGRGIKVCPEWFDKETGFYAFLEHMGRAPSETHTLDRINVDGNYQPGNVRWATPKEQAQNTRAKKRDKETIKETMLKRIRGESRKRKHEALKRLEKQSEKK